MKRIDISVIEDVKEFPKMTAGGYIARITKVTDMVASEGLKIELDIADGEFKGYYKDLYTAKGFWGLTDFRSYKEKALPFFKGFVTSIQESNIKPKPFIWDGTDEQAFVGKYVGIVLGEEEYKSKEGETKTRLYVAQYRGAKTIKDGDFVIPALKKLKASGNPLDDFYPAASTGAVDDDLPF